MKKNIFFFLLLVNLSNFCADEGKDYDSEKEEEFIELIKGDKRCHENDKAFFEQLNREIDEKIARNIADIKTDSPLSDSTKQHLRQQLKRNYIKAAAIKLAIEWAKKFPKAKRPELLFVSYDDSSAQKENNESRCCCCDSLWQYLFSTEKNKKS